MFQNGCVSCNECRIGIVEALVNEKLRGLDLPMALLELTSNMYGVRLDIMEITMDAGMLKCLCC